MTGKRSILTAQNLSIGYKRGNKILKCVHKGLTFDLRIGELTCLLGPNGAGKSTLLRTLGASQSPLEGEIYLEKKSIVRYGEKELARKISLVLTEKTFAGALRVKELVALGRHPHTGFFGRLSSYDYAIIDKAMSDTGILDKKESYVAELSDGERQKAMIAKALTQESPIIILDEPTSFLDIISRIEMMHLLHELAHKHRKAILLSTHDLEQALLSADQLWLLSKKDGLKTGNPEDLIFGGAIDHLFEHRHILLDKLSGSFRRQHKNTRLIKINADPEHTFWTRNLLNRYGFDGALPSDSYIAEIDVLSSSEIKLITNVNNFILLHSFDELANWLQTN